ncbi:MAG: hypothetical protein COA74_03255 [Gammaproteobacteria bacterium]|nr:MAG: hypothetical protein COA74_03255 [Gammaproteobacteria bacterium]
MQKKAYKYNFSDFMGQCELNYRMLCKLLPAIDDEDQFVYLVNDQFRVKFQIIERCRYTTCVRFSVNNYSNSTNTSTNTSKSSPIKNDQQPKWLTDTGVDVRLYHDALLAEVVDSRGLAMLPVNPYPNPAMLQKNEKQSLNSFLGEWLSFCLKHGQTTEIMLIARQAIRQAGTEE